MFIISPCIKAVTGEIWWWCNMESTNVARHSSEEYLEQLIFKFMIWCSITVLDSWKGNPQFTGLKKCKVKPLHHCYCWHACVAAFRFRWPGSGSAKKVAHESNWEFGWRDSEDPFVKTGGPPPLIISQSELHCLLLHSFLSWSCVWTL